MKSQMDSVLLCLIAAISAGFPWLFLINYEPRLDDPADQEQFKDLDKIDIIWTLIIIGLSFLFLFSKNRFDVFAVSALLFCLVALPEALLASLMGIYRKKKYRGGHFDYYEKHKNPKKQFFFLLEVSKATSDWMDTALLAGYRESNFDFGIMRSTKW